MILIHPCADSKCFQCHKMTYSDHIAIVLIGKNEGQLTIKLCSSCWKSLLEGFAVHEISKMPVVIRDGVII